jgi:tRNA pseudouridine38-40 synthase
MQRYKFCVEYIGTHYMGWQKQENAPSVQTEIEKAFKNFCGEDVEVKGAGRTDSGVHATGMVAHVDIKRTTTAKEIMGALNFYLKQADIAILSAEPVDDNFDARFSAQQRGYEYIILNRKVRSVMWQERAWHVKDHLNEEAMQAAAQLLVGKKIDFTSFRNVHCQAQNPVRTLDYITVQRDGDLVKVKVAARSFLHNQVRIIVGTLKEVGMGKIDQQDLLAIIAAKDRTQAPQTAPACGLYFSFAIYPSNP